MRLAPRTSAVALAVLLAGAAGCSSGTKNTTTTDTTVAGATATTAAGGTFKSATCSDPGGGTTITIKSFKFSGCPLTAAAGAAVTVTNTDGTDHSLTADDKSFDTDKFSSGSKTITIGAAGTYTFHCKVHNYMKGEIIAT